MSGIPAAATAELPHEIGPLTAGLQVTGLTKAYADTQILRGVDLRVPAGELLTVLGANGSGKSTLLRSLCGLEPADQGTVLVGGSELNRGSSSAVAMVFQKSNLVGRYSALANTCTGALGRIPWYESLAPRFFPLDVREEAMSCLDQVGLADRAHTAVRRLSGGQQQRVAVARALCQRPSVLLADEPVSALDPHAAENVMALLARLAHEGGLAVLVVLHQPEIARRYSDRIVGLRDGRVLFDSMPADLDLSTIDSLYPGAAIKEHI